MAQREELVLEVKAQLDQAMSQLEELQARLEEIATGTEATVTVAADDQATATLDEVESGVAAVDGAEAEVELDAEDNATDAVEDVQDAVDDLDGQTAEVEVQVEGGEEAESTLGGIGESLAALGPAALGGIAAAGLAKVATGSAQATLEIKGLADATGASLEQASGLAEQFDFVGVSTEKLQAMIGRVADTIATTPGLAERLNVDAALPPMDLFIAAVDALNSSQLDATDKIQLGLDVFSRRGLTAVQAIGTQVGDLSTAVGNIPDFQVVTEEDISSAIEMKETMDQVGDAVAEVAQKAVTVLDPAIDDLLGKLESLGGLMNDIASFGQQESSFADVFDFMEDMPDFVEVNDQFLEMGGTVEALRDNFFHLNEVTALLDLGIPPEVIASAKLTAEGVQLLSETMSDSAETADLMRRALDAGAVSQQEWLSITADGVITMAEATAAADGQATAAQRLTGIWGDAAIAGQELADAAAPVARSLEAINDVLNAQVNATAAAEQNWKVLLKDMEDGEVSTVAAGIAFNNLQTQLGLSDEAMDALVGNKFDAHMADIAKAEEEAAAQALKLATAMADLGDTIASVDADDFANISEGLETELNKVDDIFAGLKFDTDFQPALNEALDGLSSFAPDLQTLADEWADILEGKPIDIFGNVRADDAEFQAKMADLSNLFQEGVVNAFDQGGVEAANTFVQSTAAQIAASTGLDIAEVYRIMGLPPDGSVAMLLKPTVDAEAKADALAILDGLIGVDPNNPILAYMRLGVQTGDIPPQIAEIAAKILAGQALNVPAKLEEFSQADIDAAYALLAAQEITVPTAADITGAQNDIGVAEDATYQATIDADADTQVAARLLLDETTRQRQATIYAIAAITSAKAALDSLKERRTANILAVAYTGDAERELNHVARNRTSTIHVNTVNTGGGGGGGGGGGAGTLMAPLAVGPAAMTAGPAPMTVGPAGYSTITSAPAPTTNNLNVTVSAAVIGNRHDVNREVSKALRRHARLNGTR